MLTLDESDQARNDLDAENWELQETIREMRTALEAVVKADEYWGDVGDQLDSLDRFSVAADLARKVLTPDNA